jgi:hypothetical protein
MFIQRKFYIKNYVILRIYFMNIENCLVVIVIIYYLLDFSEISIIIEFNVRKLFLAQHTY